MKLIIPMAGRGTRLRPHTLTIPKPLLPIAGKPIVERLVEDLIAVCPEKVDEIAFIIGDFGKEVENSLTLIGERMGCEVRICHQKEQLGTAHAVLCAGDSLTGNVLVAFADTLFRADFVLDTTQDGIVWVKQVSNPEAFGVVKYDSKNTITDFVEKPETFVSDLAIIGIYYFKDGENLRKELQHLIDTDQRIKGGEFGLTTALENMKIKGLKLKTGTVIDWLDCGNKTSTVETNQTYLTYLKGNANLVSKRASIQNSTIIEPCFIGENVNIKNSIIGPYVSVGHGTIIEQSLIENSIIQENAHVSMAIMKNSMIGNKSKVQGRSLDLNIGDFNEIIL
jgi:glucose-1-phosphate thymidylyltransferase